MIFSVVKTSFSTNWEKLANPGPEEVQYVVSSGKIGEI